MLRQALLGSLVSSSVALVSLAGCGVDNPFGAASQGVTDSTDAGAQSPSASITVNEAPTSVCAHPTRKNASACRQYCQETRCASVAPSASPTTCTLLAKTLGVGTLPAPGASGLACECTDGTTAGPFCVVDCLLSVCSEACLCHGGWKMAACLPLSGCHG